MIIKHLIKGSFINRPNRFTVLFKKEDGTEELAHLRDPGRLKELLCPNAKILLRKAIRNTKRKTKYDVIGIYKDNLWILLNSGFHSDLAEELIESQIIDEISNYTVEKREYNYGKSRIDFLLKNRENPKDKMLLEVKGCTLVENKIARFPDAPTIRGKKHLEELLKAKCENYNASVLFLILKEDAEVFTPNNDTDPDFTETLYLVEKNGVKVIPFVFQTRLTDDNLNINPLKKINLK
jgi:sugar fermentation stimulation protein A